MGAPHRRKGTRVGASQMALVTLPLCLLAQTSAEGGASQRAPTVEELLRSIQKRDALIGELFDRVQELERQVGSRKPLSASDASASKEPVTQPPSQPAVAQGTAPNGVAETRPAGTPTQQSPKAASKPPGPGQFDVDEDAAERALERTLVISGALLLPFGKGELQPNFAYVRNELSQPVVFSSSRTGGQALVASSDSTSDIIAPSLFMRFGLPFDSQLELGVPWQSVDRKRIVSSGGNILAVQRTDNSDFGDVRVGLATSLLTEKKWWPDVIARLTWDSDNGGGTGSDILIGSGFHELSGSLTFTKRQDPLVFVGTASYEGSFTKNGVTPGDQLGFALGAFLAVSPETAFSMVLDQSFVGNVKTRGSDIRGTDQTLGTMNFGISSIVGSAQFVNLTAGIGLTNAAPDYSVALAYTWRFDIPFLSGVY